MSLDIIQLCSKWRVLNLHLSRGQSALLKTIYGLALTDEEFAIWAEATGQSDYLARVFRDICILAGRQSGKTTRIVTPVAIFESCVAEHAIPSTERGVFLVTAPTESQARKTAQTILDSIRGSMFNKLIESVREQTSDFCIRLANRRDIVVAASNSNTLRGPLYFGCALEEAAFFRDSQSGRYNLDAVIESIRPGMLTLPTAKLLRVSSPWTKIGTLWDDFSRRAERPETLCWRAPRWTMNPKLAVKDLERERARNETYFDREFACNFADSADQLIPVDAVEAAVERGVYEFPPKNDNYLYVTSLDPSSRGDDFALVVAHAEGEVVQVDYVQAWRAPGQGKYIDYNRVIPEVVSTMRRYGSPKAYSDQVSAAALSAALEKAGLAFEQSGTFGTKGAPKFLTARERFVSRAVRLPDQPELISQLKRLEEIRALGGKVSYEARVGKDDLGVACCAAIAHCCDEEGRSVEPWFGVLEMPPSAGALTGSALSRGDARRLFPQADEGDSRFWHEVF